MKLLLLAASLAFLVNPGKGLTCFRCSISTSLCVSKVSCGDNELCYSRNNTLLGITVYSSGCTDKEKCGKETSETFAGVKYKMVTRCCDYDLCNSSAGLQLSFLTVLVGLTAWVSRFL
ncbi:sperm acrosome membrane-associated protein 4-like [Stegostoma tigrinum]|uniref:sperm acrosome membrane-associated protein 4-like n=1 Tax=Stegostoma tigrinum TaxID=3053191 RepID=UPI0028707559|nr:sperm acrosome membrane-associated protein 4-like [Stegostoma tigrinum]